MRRAFPIFGESGGSAYGINKGVSPATETIIS